jgi:hypothetical protein
MRSLSFFGSAVLFVVLVACGGSQPPPSNASSEGSGDEAPAADAPAAAESTDGDAAEEPTADKPAKPEVKEPEFKENGTVDEAIAAVPVATERLNLDQETLGKPLQDFSLYEPCKLPPTAHFKFRVAVWNGKAVGLDMSSTPKNPKLEECIKGRIRELTWKDKVKALNTVEYQF